MERRAVTVRGIVQGVGFRPFVYTLASRHHLNGFVKNRTGSVLIEVEGDRAALDQFLDDLQTTPPPLSRIDDVSWQTASPVGEIQFRIESSDAASLSQVFVSPDVATCFDCLAEVLTPRDRRYHYPFLNCTNCGPRLTIIRGAPYDRERTTMAGFSMCAACRAEYEDPSDRRFHAQPTACPACGPWLQLRDAQGETSTDAPLTSFAESIRQGGIGALKGLGGYHLVCDARSEAVVTELRRRKHRDEKPFAVMVPDADTAERLCAVNADERTLLESRQRPIVLLRRRAKGNGVAASVAPGNPCLGIMLPYTPLHHLLMQEAGAMPLVMTSGNQSDEPIAYLDEDALIRLGDVADLFLLHNRPIHVRCDDSVVRVVDGQTQLVRRSRGYAPAPIKLPFASPRPLLAVGADLKGVFALGRDRQAFLSHHMGDLDHFEAYRAFERDIGLYEQLFDVKPELIVHDLHPDYASTGYAERRAAAAGLPRLAVQHHHAHLASCLAENGLQEPAIGVSFDGTGYGVDGAIWGGEILVGDYRSFYRAAHLRYVPLPGGDRAVKEPWRMAVSHGIDAECAPPHGWGNIGLAAARTVEQMIRQRINAPWTSSAGRLFDAVAALAGVRERVSYEGQAAIELEWAATDAAGCGSYPFDIVRHPAPGNLPHRDLVGWQPAPEVDVIDTRPLVAALVEDVANHVGVGVIARRFHETMAQIIGAVCARIRLETGIRVVALSGGVFMNALLTRLATTRLQHDGFQVVRHRLVPPNDGGLSLGQIAIAAAYTN